MIIFLLEIERKKVVILVKTSQSFSKMMMITLQNKNDDLRAGEQEKKETENPSLFCQISLRC